jgi:cyanophycinase
MRRLTFLIALLVSMVTGLAAQTPTQAPTPPPSGGSLFIVGGGPRSADLMRRFVALAGGPDTAVILVLPMASADSNAGPSLVRELQGLGARARFAVITRAQADSDQALAQLEGITGIWFNGGVQSRLTEALGGTRFEEGMNAAFRRGLAIGGTSAGAAVMSAVMITGGERRPGGSRPVTEDHWLTIEGENVVTTRGFGFLTNAIVDQHFLRRKRYGRLLSLAIDHPTLIGVGIDEGTALEVAPNGLWTVRGMSKVLIVDPRPAVRDRAAGTFRAAALHVLKDGDRFMP